MVFRVVRKRSELDIRLVLKLLRLPSITTSFSSLSNNLLVYGGLYHLLSRSHPALYPYTQLALPPMCNYLQRCLLAGKIH